MTEPTYLARRTPGMGLKDIEAQIDMARLRSYRLGRCQDQLAADDLAGAILLGPLSIRYATGTRSGSMFNFHTPFRAAFVPAEGGAVLFDGDSVGALAPLETLAEIRPMPIFNYFWAGPRIDEKARDWAGQVAALLKAAGGGKRIAVDMLDPTGTAALADAGLDIVAAQPMLEQARAIKSADEVACMLFSISVADAGMARMREALRSGMTENALFALLHERNIALGGEWIEYRALVSGGRTNPWGQETGDRMIRAGELLGFDCGMVGPFSYVADVSRTFRCGPGKPTDEQRRLYRTAYENIQFNLALIKPGVSFREIMETGWKIPDEFVANRYPTSIHGIGMSDEWPMIKHPQDWDDEGYDGVLEENMTVCVESYIGAQGGAEGVKLEEQVLITKDGYQLLSTFPYEDALLA